LVDELDAIRKQKIDEMVAKQSTGDFHEHPIKVTDADFGEITKKYPLVLVDFWAEWCGPCKMIAPVIDELSKEYSGKVVFAKVNVDENITTPMQFNAMSIPTLVLLKDGKEVNRIIGAVPKEYLDALIKPHLS
jgi:thioredoxin 1